MRLIMMFALLVTLCAGTVIAPNEASAQQASVSFQVFYDQLSPYGSWVDYPQYGYVWMPKVEQGFTPYATAGHWVYTDDGWTWVSDYPWGWAPFHYGRWDRNNAYGWFWVPDNEWGPAWVSWRSSPGYYGWAPLRPGISMNMALSRDYHEQNDRWIFVRDRDMSNADVSKHYVNRSRNVTLINTSTVILDTRKDSQRNVSYIAGPDRNAVQKVARAPIVSVAIRENDQPGHRLSNGELQIYRPQVQRPVGNGQTPTPTRVVKLKDVQPVSKVTAGKRPMTANPTRNVGENQRPQGTTPPRQGGQGERSQPGTSQHTQEGQKQEPNNKHER